MIVIPMAGLSRRFTVAGYTKPKYMLDLPDGSVFSHAISSFKSYFSSIPFLFVAQPIGNTHDFIVSECQKLGIAEYHIQLLSKPTAGQAETVEKGLKLSGVDDQCSLTIFNIDTFRPGFHFPDSGWHSSDGYLEVFRGSGANWSYVRPRPAASEPLVAETAEKKPISDLCCSGLYHFSKTSQFLAALAYERESPSAGELYVAPLYNHLISDGCKIHYNIIEKDEVIFCGIPSEYEAILNEKT